MYEHSPTAETIRPIVSARDLLGPVRNTAIFNLILIYFCINPPTSKRVVATTSPVGFSQ